MSILKHYKKVTDRTDKSIGISMNRLYQKTLHLNKTQPLVYNLSKSLFNIKILAAIMVLGLLYRRSYGNN